MDFRFHRRRLLQAAVGSLLPISSSKPAVVNEREVVLHDYIENAIEQYSFSIEHQTAILGKPASTITSSEYSDVMGAASGPYDGNYENAVESARKFAAIKPIHNEVEHAVRDFFKGQAYTEEELTAIIERTYADSLLSEQSLVSNLDLLKAQDAAQAAKAQTLCKEFGLDWESGNFQDVEKIHQNFADKEKQKAITRDETLKASSDKFGDVPTKGASWQERVIPSHKVPCSYLINF
jgi:hypothetical protein